MGLLDKAKQRLAAMSAERSANQAAAAEQRSLVAASQADYRGVLSTLQWLDMDDAAFAELAELRARASLPPKDAEKLEPATFLRAAEEALEDDLLTLQEQGRLLTFGSVLGITSDMLQLPEWSALRDRLVIAGVNDGRLPVLEASDVTIILKRGEVAHASAGAVLLKQVALKEWQGKSAGFSFRIAKGVRYNTGSLRGKMVTVGSQVVAEDSGILWLTNQRCVFRGDKKLLEFAHPKLVDVRVFSDGIGLAVSNRQTPSTFRIVGASSEAIAAMLNAAVQRGM